MDKVAFRKFCDKYLYPDIDFEKILFNKSNEAVQDNCLTDAIFYTISVLALNPDNQKAQKQITQLTLNKVESTLKERMLVNVFLLEICKNVLSIAFKLNLKNNEFSILVAHMFGSGEAIDVHYKKKGAKIIKIGKREETNEFILRHDGESFRVIINSIDKSISVIISEKNTKYSENDIRLEDNKSKDVKGIMNKNILQFNLSKYFPERIEKLA